MCEPVSFLVRKQTFEVYAIPGIHSHSQIAEKCGISEDDCYHVEFLPQKRQFRWGGHPPRGVKDAGEEYIEQIAGDWKKLRAYVKGGGIGIASRSSIFGLICGEHKDLQEAANRLQDRGRNNLIRFNKRTENNWRETQQKANEDRDGRYHELWAAYVKEADRLFRRAERDIKRDYKTKLIPLWVKIFSQKRYRIDVWK